MTNIAVYNAIESTRQEIATEELKAKKINSEKRTFLILSIVILFIAIITFIYGQIFWGVCLSILAAASLVNSFKHNHHIDNIQIFNSAIQFAESDLCIYNVVGLMLDDDEKCFYTCDGINTKQSSRVVGYSGSSSGVSLPSGIKGVRFRVGGYKSTAVRRTYTETIDQGTLFITNKRIIYSATKKSFDLKKSLISTISWDGNTLYLLKKNNKNSYSVELGALEMFCFKITLIKLGFL